MILLASCVTFTVLSYYTGVKTSGKGNGTVKGWTVCIVMGVLLAASYYAFSAYGMLFSLDSLLADF